MAIIQNKIESIFSMATKDVMSQNSTADTQDDMIQDAIQDTMVIFVSENKYSLSFVISGGTYVVNDNNNTSLNNQF